MKKYFCCVKKVLVLTLAILLFCNLIFLQGVLGDEGYLWPVPATRYISQYFTGKGSHEGIDIAANGDIEVVAARSGTVIAAASTVCPDNHNRDNCSFGMGNYVQIQQNDGRYSTYMHLRYGSLTVSVGQHVNQGDKLGMMGSSGNSTGQHLHYQLTETTTKKLINTNPDALRYKYEITPSDTTPPTIEEVKFDPHNHTELMLKVKATDSSGISEVRCNHKGAWRSERDWHLNYMVPQSNGEWHLMLRPDDGYGDYDIHLYVRDNAGNESFYATNTGFGTEEPSIKDCDVIDLDDSGFTISGEYSSGHASLEYFKMPVWTTYNDQDDIREEMPDRIDGNRFYKRINFSEHNNERGPYNFHMYLRNKANLDGFSGINGYSPVYESIKTIEKDGHIYALYDNALSWKNAKKKAEEFGGHLATIKNQEEQTVVNELIASGNKKGYWLGGYKDNQWKWITSEDFTYNNWASTQPDNAYNREDKLMVFKEGNYEIGEWNDASNEDYIKMGFIIEYEPQLDNAVFTEMLNGHTYKVYPENLTWNEAKEKCENLGGHLITANTPEEQQLVEKITSNYGSNYWLGGKLDETNVWRWVTGEVIQPQYWALGQPDHGQGEPYLGTCTDNGLWNDYGNVSDNIDGYILEIEHANAETAKSVIHNGKEYIRYDVGLPWNEAQQYCESQGGHLAIIRDEATQQAIAELIQGGRARYLLGASDAENEGDWKWLDGSALTYTHWGNAEPNNYKGNEDYLIMDSNGNWNDVILTYSGMSTIQGFICEKNPVKKGDLNNDGRVDIMDARKAKRAAMKEVHLTGSELSAADLNGDGKVDIMEARKIKRAAMKEISFD